MVNGGELVEMALALARGALVLPVSCTQVARLSVSISSWNSSSTLSQHSICEHEESTEKFAIIKCFLTDVLHVIVAVARQLRLGSLEFS